MGLLRRIRRLDDAVLGAPPASAADRLVYLRRFYARGVVSATGPGVTAAVLIELAERVDLLERRLAQLESSREDS